MKLERIDDNLVVTIPLKTKRYNPYDEQENREMNNIVGVIRGHHEGENDWDEMGFMYLQDFDYKGKEDQLTDWCIKWSEGTEEFEKLCEYLQIPLWKI